MIVLYGLKVACELECSNLNLLDKSDIKLHVSHSFRTCDAVTFRKQILKPELDLANLHGTAECTNNSCIRVIKFANISLNVNGQKIALLCSVLTIPEPHNYCLFQLQSETGWENLSVVLLLTHNLPIKKQ